MSSVTLSAQSQRLPAYIVAACKKGLEYVKQGFAGDGLKPATVDQARKAVRVGEWSNEKIKKASAWFARHESDLVPGSFDEERPKPGAVAWLLWGSDPDTDDKGRQWIDKQAAEIKERAADEMAAKSDPSTPAPPKDRIKGSDKNKAGSAAAGGDGVKVSETVERALQNKLQQHLSEYTEPGQRTTLAVLKKVYRRGAGAYSSSHRPNVTRAAWAMARVGAFLYLLAKGKPKKPQYITDNDLLPDEHPIKMREQQRGTASDGADLNLTLAKGAQMPVKECTLDGLPGYQWGRQGECHTYEQDDAEAEARALQAAEADGKAKYEDAINSDADMSADVVGLPSAVTMAAPESIGDGDGDLHIMRLGPLYDLGDGKLVIDLTEELAKQIAENTQRMIIEAGHFLPISFEHGIEAGHRGEPGDRKPYGMIKRVYYKPGKGIYASKQWSKIGAELVKSSMMADGTTALRVSPRVNGGEAHHPDTGEAMGKGYIDVVSLTTLPRQNNMLPVAMSRSADEGLPIGNPVEMMQEGNQPACRADDDAAGQNSEANDMAKTNQKTANPQHKDDNEVIIVLSRGSNEQVELFRAAGLDDNAEISEVIERVAEMSKTNEVQAVELARFKQLEQERELAQKTVEINRQLDEHQFDSDAERGFYEAILLGSDADAAELARKTLAKRNAVDPIEAVEVAIVEAKKIGAVAADFRLTEQTAELARQNPDLAIAMLGLHGAGAVVPVGEPAGDDAAGVDGGVELNREQAAAELSREAHKIYNEQKAGGNVISLADAHNLARGNRPDLHTAIYGEVSQ